MLETPESIVISTIKEANLLLSSGCDLDYTEAVRLENQLRAFANQLLQSDRKLAQDCFNLARDLRKQIQPKKQWEKTTELILARRFDSPIYPEQNHELIIGISTMIVAKLHLLLDGKEILETSGIRFGFVGDGLPNKHISGIQLHGNRKGDDWVAPVKRRAQLRRGKDLCGFMNDIAIQQGFSDFDRMSMYLCKDVERPGGTIVDDISLSSCTLDSKCPEASGERKYISLSHDPDDIINQIRTLVYEITEMACQLSNFGGLPRPRIVGRVLDGGKRFSR